MRLFYFIYLFYHFCEMELVYGSFGLYIHVNTWSNCTIMVQMNHMVHMTHLPDLYTGVRGHLVGKLPAACPCRAGILPGIC